MLCFLREFPSPDVELDLFKPELDAFCIELARTGVLRACRSRTHAATGVDTGAIAVGAAEGGGDGGGGGAEGSATGSAATSASASSSAAAAAAAAATEPTLLMADWYRRNVEFLPRCVAYFGARLHLVIHAALMAQAIDVV